MLCPTESIFWQMVYPSQTTGYLYTLVSDFSWLFVGWPERHSFFSSCRRVVPLRGYSRICISHGESRICLSRLAPPSRSHSCYRKGSYTMRWSERRHGYRLVGVGMYQWLMSGWDLVFSSCEVVIMNWVEIASSLYDLEDSSDLPAFDCYSY